MKNPFSTAFIALLTVISPCRADDLVGIWRLYNGVDHFYTTDCDEANRIQETYWPEWQVDNLLRIQKNQTPGTHPVYRFYNGTHHFYTIDQNEGTKAGASLEGVIGYIYDAPTLPHFTYPWYRSYNPKTGDHFYTTNGWFSRNQGDYIFEGIVGYGSIYSDDRPICVPGVAHPREQPSARLGRAWCFCNIDRLDQSCHFSAVLTGSSWDDLKRQCADRTHGWGTLVPK